MNVLPEIIVTGFPYSGTSFVCNLIVLLGKSPGKDDDLKKGDSHNRWGYFENLRIRNIVYKSLPHNRFIPWADDYMPDFPIEVSNKYGELLFNNIQKIAKEDGLEIYKDNSIPITFKLFPKETKIIYVTREAKKCYKSPKGGNQPKIKCSFNAFIKYYKKYDKLANIMINNRNCLVISYEDFNSDFYSSVEKIVAFLNIDISAERKKELLKIFRPRVSFISKIKFFCKL